VNQRARGRTIRSLLSVSILAALLNPAFADNAGVRDSEFDKVPFAEWFSRMPEARLKWSERVLPVTLSAHQRLMAQVQIQLDGAELVKRRGAGKMIFYFQFNDSEGRTYQDHAEYDLAKAETPLKGSVAISTDSAFVLPGDYSVSLAIYFTATGEHAAKRDTLHVPSIDADPLPDLWRDLPSVDFVDISEPPDCWFLPKERGDLHLPLDPRFPVQIDVVANLASSDLSTPSYRPKDVDLSVLLPYLKVLSQVKGSNIRKSFSLLDVERRRVIFEQRDVDELDWEKMRSSIKSVKSGLIDRTSLASRPDVAGFFVREVARRLASGDSSGPRVVIVLTGEMIFDAKQNRPQVEIKSSPRDRLIYIRMRSAPHFRTLSVPETNRRVITVGKSRQQSRAPLTSDSGLTSGDATIDELAHMFSVPGLRLFDVRSPDAFRKALAAILSEIANL
jgi:hypothetical protein